MTKLKVLHLIAASALLSAAPGAQQPSAGAPADSTLSCVEILDRLKAKAEANYAGFLLEVKRDRSRLADYHRSVARLRTRAATTLGSRCFFVLRDYIDWFDDPHLFVYQGTRIDTAETARRAAAMPVVDMDEEKARAYLSRNAARLDPVEGIWSDGALRVAVVPEPEAPRGRFVAVVLSSDTTTWRPGTVRARLVHRSDGRYETAMLTRAYAEQHLIGEIHKHVLLRFSPGLWGRVFPLAPSDSGLVDPADPRRATLLVRGGAVIVSMPTHDPSYKPALDSLVAANDSVLRAAERLIVDLRGNEGGSAFTSSALMPFIVSERMRPERLRFRESLMMSSEDQMWYAARAFGPDTTPRVQRLLARMKAHPGELVPLFDSLDAPFPEGRDSVVYGPRRVGILIDGGTVSAAEVLVLDGLRSERVTVFGKPTAGALDYQSTFIVSLAPGDRRWYLGYPTITASASLPAGGMRGKGIAPTVRLDLARTRDAIAAADSLLRR